MTNFEKAMIKLEGKLIEVYHQHQALMVSQLFGKYFY